jgi:membrane protease YdiL (CAAX protease family)
VTDWTTFAGLVGVVLTLLLVLARISQGQLPQSSTTAEFESTATGRNLAERESTEPSTVPAPFDGPTANVPAGMLLANVAVSQGLFACLLVVGAWLTEIPPSALGLDAATPSLLGLGVGVGVVLYAANEVGSTASERVGAGGEEALREALAPGTRREWILLLCVVLPIIAGFEELLFRAALVGALSVGFGVSPWLLALLSSVAFALGHGAQGAGGVVVTGVLGAALAAVFVLTGSLLVVVVAHYLVNALAFVVHEGLDVDPLG